MPALRLTTLLFQLPARPCFLRYSHDEDDVLTGSRDVEESECTAKRRGWLESSHVKDSQASAAPQKKRPRPCPARHEDTMNTTASGVPALGRPIKPDENAAKPLDISAEVKKTQEHNAAAVNGAPKDSEKQQHQQPAADEKKGPGDESAKKEAGPAGGYDATPIPYRPGGYTIKMTIHRASNLPMADLNSLSSDPFVLAEIKADQPATRHKEDPPLRTRTRTIRRSTDPEWNAEWIVANAPSSGFKIKMRVYDEDPADKDDRLGNVHIHIPSINESWPGIKEKSYGIEKRAGSKRAYAIRAVATCFRVAKHMHGDLWLSVELLGKTPEDGQNGRMYTIGPQWWTRHFSPLLGRLANTHAPDEEKDAQQQQENGGNQEKQQPKRYDFQANQMQLKGPVPPELYHRYVEVSPAKRTRPGTSKRTDIISSSSHGSRACSLPPASKATSCQRLYTTSTRECTTSIAQHSGDTLGQILEKRSPTSSLTWYIGTKELASLPTCSPWTRSGVSPRPARNLG